MSMLGWIGSFFFAVCAAPQALMCWRQGHAKGISEWYLLFWLIGELASIAYVITNLDGNLPLLANYVSNLGFWAMIMWRKAYPKKIDF